MDFAKKLVTPRARIYVPELFAELAKMKALPDKIEALQAYQRKDQEHANLIRDVVQSMFHPAVVFDLPPGAPPYKTDYLDYNMAPSTLVTAFKRLPYFVESHSKHIKNPVKRESVYIQTLESLYKDDAELFVMIKNKKMDSKKYKGVTETLFRAAFPGMLPDKSPKSETGTEE